MKRNKLLSTSIRFFSSIRIIYGLIILLIVIASLHSLISPSVYRGLIISAEGKTSNLNIRYDSYTLVPDLKRDCSNFDNKLIFYAKLDVSSKLRLLIYLIVPCIIWFLILDELLHFFKSSRDYSSFFVNNSKYFKRIGWFFIILLVFPYFFNFLIFQMNMVFPDGMVQRKISMVISINEIIEGLIYILLSFIAGLVFKEGENLKVENELTI